MRFLLLLAVFGLFASTILADDSKLDKMKPAANEHGSTAQNMDRPPRMRRGLYGDLKKETGGSGGQTVGDSAKAPDMSNRMVRSPVSLGKKAEEAAGGSNDGKLHGQRAEDMYHA